jgi:hypothetical protein
MKGTKLGIAAILLFFSFSCLAAQDINRKTARQELIRTARVIKRARIAVNEHKNYTGKLALSVRHQQFAILLFKWGKYTRSLYQTIRARILAFAAIRDNGGIISDNEIAAMNIYKTPPDSEIDADFQNNAVKENIKDDDAAIQQMDTDQGDLDIKVK